MDRVTNIAWKTIGGTPLGGFAYEYDAVGRIVSRSHALGTNAFDRVYAYDDLDRLAFGSCSFSVLTIAFSIPQGIARGSSQVVTHWGPAGVTELRSGDWVMTGGASFRNLVMAGAKTSRQGWQASITTTVPKASLRYPSGREWWKGLIGQRVYKP